MSTDDKASPVEGDVSPLPCPFCGGIRIAVSEGSTFRWRYAGCLDCGAQAGEIRKQTLGAGHPNLWERQAETDAIVEWNKRANVKVTGSPALSASPSGLPGYATEVEK